MLNVIVSCQILTSRYSCPTCSVPYCSVACFRSQQRHFQCSEAFYKSNILSHAAAAADGAVVRADGDTRKRTQDMLIRFEKEAGQRTRNQLEEDEATGKK
jgi:hypothetical protein